MKATATQLVTTVLFMIIASQSSTGAALISIDEQLPEPHRFPRLLR